MRRTHRTMLAIALMGLPAVVVAGLIAATAPAAPPQARTVVEDVIVHGVAANPQLVPAGGQVLVDGIGRNLGAAPTAAAFINR